MVVAVTIAMGKPPALSVAQAAPALNQPDSISIHISAGKNSYVVGEQPITVMAMKNTSQNQVCFSTASYLYRIHLTSNDGEPRKTELDRHMRGDFRPGDVPALDGGSAVCRPIAPGASDSLKYDLAAYYDLSTPGNYSVYLEIYDPAGPKDGSGHWIRTNTTNFKIEAPV